MQSQAPEKIDEARYETIYADPSKIKQVLYNLLSNAIKFTLEGGLVEVEAVTTTITDQVADCIKISVRDTGRLVSPDSQKRVWREFEQVDSTYARAQQGTGLGLALTRRLVELHGGKIWVKSTGVKGQGSVFSFELPLNRSSHPSDATEDKESTAPPLPEVERRIGRPLVLVVEDDDVAFTLLESHLQSGGYSVARSQNGADALVKARKLHPDAITLDILLPDRPGWEVLDQLKADARTRKIPVIVVSITDDKHLGLSLGAVEFLVKPVRREELLDAIGRHPLIDHRNRCRILIVDDEPWMVEPLVVTLRNEGYEVDVVDNASAGLVQIESHRPDFLILDLVMPEMNGMEMIERIRSNPSTSDLPILIHTCKDLSAEELSHLRQHVLGVSTKPGYERLIADLKRVCTQQSKPRSSP